MGRPPRTESGAATAQVNVRMSAEERARLEKMAVELRSTAGEVVRRALDELHDRVFAKRGKR